MEKIMLGFLSSVSALVVVLVVLLLVVLSVDAYQSYHDRQICYKKTGLYSGCKLKEQVQTHKIQLE